MAKKEVNLRELSIDDLVDRAEIIIEALPYISAFRNKVIVIKYGGSAMLDPELKEAVIQDIALMELAGMKVVVVHGGGPAINEHLDRLGIEAQFVNGQRVTTSETLDVVGMVLSRLNRELVSGLNQVGATAVGVTGKDAQLIEARKHFPGGSPEKGDLGFVGEVERINPRILRLLLEDEIVPVVLPIGINMEEGQAYNINADVAAAAIAAEMKADKLILLTEAPGIMRDINEPGSTIPQIQRGEIEGLISDGIIAGGMIPKVRACMESLEAGVGKTHILDGRLPHSLLLELLTDKGIGTLIY